MICLHIALDGQVQVLLSRGAFIVTVSPPKSKTMPSSVSVKSEGAPSASLQARLYVPLLASAIRVSSSAVAMSFRISLTASVKCSPPAEYPAYVIPKLVGGKCAHECAHICQLLTEIPVKCGFGIFIKCGEVA